MQQVRGDEARHPTANDGDALEVSGCGHGF
jgi:hypothetical protein